LIDWSTGNPARAFIHGSAIKRKNQHTLPEPDFKKSN